MARRDLGLLIALGGLLPAPVAHAKPLDVCPACAYATIRAALQAASPGDRVRVAPGTYREGPLRIDRPLTLEPADPAHPPVLDGQDRDEILTVTASGVTVRGLRFRGGGHAATRDIAAIRVERASGCVIADNVIEEATFGIYLAKSEGCSLLRNRIHSSRKDLDSAGSGIHVWSGRNIEVIENEISGQRDGIYFEFVNESRVIGNRSQDNLRYGLHFMFSHGDTYQGNRFAGNESGVAVMYSRGIVMTANRFEDSHGAASYGVLLKDITDSEIHGNLFRDNTTAMYVEDASRVRVADNDFDRNGWAIRLIGSSDGNRFERNNFTANTFEVAAQPGGTTNTFDSNYWSQYEGLDLDHDGIGDQPYRPVRLSAIWMQNVEGASFLLGSFFMALVDGAEAMLPVLTPETVADAHPLIGRRP